MSQNKKSAKTLKTSRCPVYCQIFLLETERRNFGGKTLFTKTCNIFSPTTKPTALHEIQFRLYQKYLIIYRPMTQLGGFCTFLVCVSSLSEQCLPHGRCKYHNEHLQFPDVPKMKITLFGKI